MPAIGVHHTDVKDGAWDGPEAKANLKNDGTEAYYRKAFAWQDASADATTKTAYKFIHHFVSSGGDIGDASKVACSAGIAILNGGRGGADIPEGDRKGVWSHLAAHLRDFGVAEDDIPKLRSAHLVTLERRTFAATEFRMEDGTDGKMPKIVGHAAVFNQPSEEMGSWMSFREQIAPGCFKDSIAADDIRALFNHDPNFVLGRNRAGTLKLNEDGKGLRVDITPPDTSWARDLVTSIERGDISQMSFGFDVQEDTWVKRESDSEPALRTLKKVRLFDVSPVTFPAYPQTDVNTRSLDAVWAEGLSRMPIAEVRPSGIALLRRRLELEA